VARQQPPSARFEGGLFSSAIRCPISRLSERSPLLATRHLVATPALVAAPTPGSIAATAALLEAARAIDWLIAAGLEGHFRLLATARAGSTEHLAFATTA